MTIAEAVYKRGQGRNPMKLNSVDDVDHLVEQLRTDTNVVPHNLAQVYSLKREKLPSGQPDHELLVGIDGERGVGILSFMDASGNVVTTGDTGPLFVEYFLTGNVTEFDAEQPMELPIDEIRQALKEFLTDGNRPKSVQWQPLGREAPAAES
jgi:hypothetical protein